MNHPQAKEVWGYIFKQLKPFPSAVFFMLVAVTFSAAYLSIKPYVLKQIIDNLESASPQNAFISLLPPIGLYLATSFSVMVLYRLVDYFVYIKAVPMMRANMINHALSKLLNKDYYFYQKNLSGSLSNKINDLTHSVPYIIDLVAHEFIRQTASLMMGIFTLWQVHRVFGAMMLGWFILFMIVGMLLSSKLARLSHDWSERGSFITGKLADIFANALSVRLFANAATEQKMLQPDLAAAVSAERRNNWAYLYTWLLQGSFVIGLQIANFCFLCKGWQEGWVSTGDFVLVIGINASITDFLWGITDHLSQFSKLYGRITQALATIFDQSEFKENPKARPLVVTKGRILFVNVKFHYNHAEPLFEHLTVAIEGGQKVGLVGYSGGGKTTFAHLLLRLHDANEGQILIDDQNIKDCTQKSLRQAIAMIPQNTSLFHRNLHDNIAYGTPQASKQEIIAAATKAHAHDFIVKLANGYDTLVQEHGSRLSGGQRQRIAIARAVLKNAPILILDEATSQLDSLTEQLIQQSLWDLMEGKTSIVIAHRLSTLLQMDRILVFNRGVIVEDGPHRELLAKGGLYKKLWDTQVGGFLADTP